MGEQRLPESHSISSFSFSEMQLGRLEHHVGSAVHGCLARAGGVLGLQAGVHLACIATQVWTGLCAPEYMYVHSEALPQVTWQVACQGLLIVFSVFH